MNGIAGVDHGVDLAITGYTEPVNKGKANKFP